LFPGAYIQSVMRGILLLLAVSLIVTVSQPLFEQPSAATVVRMDLEQQADLADLVLEGTVASARPLRAADGTIRTEYELLIDRTLWGEPRARRIVTLPGGALPSGLVTLIPGMPVLSVGEDCLLLLGPETTTGLRIPVGLGQGRLRLGRGFDGRRTLAQDHVGLSFVSRTGLRDAEGGSIQDYSEVISRLQARLNVRRREQR
jgi:hypothetical protein